MVGGIFACRQLANDRPHTGSLRIWVFLTWGNGMGHSKSCSSPAFPGQMLLASSER